MADPIELAKAARSTLANALSALQSHPEAPEELLEIAAPIAQTMGVLHRIEKSEGKELSEVSAALDRVRGALDSLQQLDMDHEAVDDAMEHVAGSLAKLFALSKAAKASNRGIGGPSYKVPDPVAVAPPTNPEPAVARKKGPPSVPRPVSRPPSKPAPAKPGPAPAAPAPAALAPTPAPAPQFTSRGTVKMDDARGIQAQVRAEAAKTESLSGGIDMPQAQPAPTRADPMGKTVPEPAAQAPAQPTVPAAPAAPRTATAPAGARIGTGIAPQRVPGMTDAPVPSAGTQHVEVMLGAHSSSNFYKGLSGNDVVDHGGIFVQTYQIPAVGTAIALRVLLPGDLEFDADALVQWTRETRSGESDPGFGAKFTRIADAGRQLVYRYVRNREPMFYDDL